MRHNITIVYNELLINPYKFKVNQALKILEENFSEKIEFGKGFLSSEEPIKLTNYMKFSTPKSDCIKIDSHKNLFILNSTGLLGLSGALPIYYTEKAFFAMKNKNNTFIDFINIFQHRYLCLKYKTEKKYEQTLKPKFDFESIYMISGLLNNKLQYSLTPLLSCFANRTKSVNNLTFILKKLLNIDIIIHEFQERWYKIDKKSQFTLDYSSFINKALGYKNKNIQSAIKIDFMFEDYNKYMKYLKDEKKRQLIKDILKYYLNDSISIKIKLKIIKFIRQTLKLDFQNNLGKTTWI